MWIAEFGFFWKYAGLPQAASLVLLQDWIAGNGKPILNWRVAPYSFS